MSMPFPGMDPYLEHPTLWTGVHSGLINTIRSRIAPALRPRYVASIEERVMIDLPSQQRVPDVWIQKTQGQQSGSSSQPPIGSGGIVMEEPIVMEISSDPIKEPYIEILDRYQNLKVVTVIELLSPINKTVGPGRDEYLRKRETTLHSSTHLVEIDLLRNGRRSIPFTSAQLDAINPFDYLVAINRFQPGRTQYEIITRTLRNSLPTFGIPLVAPDPDVALDLQAALSQVYEDASYMLRINYERPCHPALLASEQSWVHDRWTEYRNDNLDLLGTN